MKPVPEVTHDFDLIAAAMAEAPPHRRLTSAENVVLASIPAHASSALDVGCGDGTLARAIARRGLDVTAIDISPRMIALARERTTDEAVEYRVADVMDAGSLAPAYDVVVSVNMVHHLPLEVILPRLASLVAPGGALVVQDVVTRPGLRYLPVNIVAAVQTRGRRLFAGERVPRRVRQLYDRHGRGERYLQPHMVEREYARYLGRVRVAHHLAWRYTAVWSRPQQG